MPKYTDQPPPYSATAPPPGFEPPLIGEASSVIYTQTAGGPRTVIISAPQFGPISQRVICPSCHADVETKVGFSPSTKTHLIALVLCLLQCYICCCLPYCMESCQDATHYCPNCRAYLGTFKG